MGRWYANAEEYLTHYDRKADAWRVIAGPFSRNTPVIALVLRSHDLTRQVYSVSSRYSLAKYKAFPKTKAGDAALLAAIERPALAEQAVRLLGQQSATLGGGYDAADWASLDTLLIEAGLLYEPGPLALAVNNDFSSLVF
jgi:hypothetical protein